MPSLPAELSSDPVGRRQLSGRELAAKQRERVIAAAIGAFAERGYPETSVDDVVAAARISVGGFYELFANREDCFLAAYAATVADAREQIEAALPSGGPQPQRVLAALAKLLELIAAEPLAARLVLVEAQSAGPRALALHQEQIEALVPELRRCRRSSPFGSELPASLELATIGGLAWYLQQRLLRGEADDPAALLPEVAEVVLEPYLGPERTAELLATI